MRKSQLAIGLTIFEILNDEKGIPKTMQHIVFELANRKVIEKEMSRRTFGRYINDLNDYLPFNIRIEYVRSNVNGYIIKELDKKAISDEMANRKLKDPTVKRALENAVASRTFLDVAKAQKLLQDNFGSKRGEFERYYSNEMESGLSTTVVDSIREAIESKRNIDFEVIDREGRHWVKNITPLWIVHKPSSFNLYFHDKTKALKNISFQEIRYILEVEILDEDKGSRFDFQNMDDYINEFGELSLDFKPMELLVPIIDEEKFFSILRHIDFPMYFSTQTSGDCILYRFKHLSKNDRELIKTLAIQFNGKIKK